MADLFADQNSSFGGAFAASKASMTFSTGDSGNGGLGLLVQNVQAQYQQNVERLWELSSGNKTYFVVGRAQGTVQIGRIVGPEVIADSFVTQYSAACNVEKNVMRINATPGMCKGGVGADRTFKFVLVNSIALQMASSNMVVSETLGAMFASLDNSKSGSSGNAALNAATAATGLGSAVASALRF